VGAQIFRTKSLDKILGDTNEDGHALKKVLGPWNLIALGVGAVIGAGIFTAIGSATAGDELRPGAGPALMLSFVITAVVCAFTALCYAEFASMVPVAGSAYTYAYGTLGELVAWIIGWDLMLEYAIGNVAVAISWGNYMRELLHDLGLDVPIWLATDYRSAAPKALEDFPHVTLQLPHIASPHIFGVPIIINVLAIGIVALITVVLIWGVRESARFNAIIVLLKLAVLAFFVLVCMGKVHPENWHPFAPNGWKGIGAGAAVIFFAFIGFDAVSTCAEECKNPARDMPIGIIGSLVACTIIYVVIAAVFTGIMPYQALVATPAADRADPLTLAMRYVEMRPWMVAVVALGSVVAQTAVLLVFQLGQPRIFFSMARDGLLPQVFAKVHPRFQTPHVSTILTGVIVAVASGFANIDEMVDLTNIGTLFAFVLVCIGIIILRYRDPGRVRSFKVPGGPIAVPLIGLLSCIGLMIYLPPSSWMRFVGWLAAGLVVYFLYGYRHSRLRTPAPAPAAPR
jgi:APA family basic amino acid/polyamine antiporter